MHAPWFIRLSMPANPRHSLHLQCRSLSQSETKLVLLLSTPQYAHFYALNSTEHRTL